MKKDKLEEIFELQRKFNRSIGIDTDNMSDDQQQQLLEESQEKRPVPFERNGGKKFFSNVKNNTWHFSLNNGVPGVKILSNAIKRLMAENSIAKNGMNILYY